VGALGYHELTTPKDAWEATDTEEETHRRMSEFQKSLDRLKADFQKSLDALKTDAIVKDAETLSKPAEVLSKQIEAQGEIEDLIVKFRESQHAKYAWLVNTFGVLAAAVIGALAGRYSTRKEGED
jgi:hypothetical protein